MTQIQSRYRVTLVAFVWLFAAVSFQMCLQSTCLRGCKVTLVAFFLFALTPKLQQHLAHLIIFVSVVQLPKKLLYLYIYIGSEPYIFKRNFHIKHQHSIDWTPEQKLYDCDTLSMALSPIQSSVYKSVSLRGTMAPDAENLLDDIW